MQPLSATSNSILFNCLSASRNADLIIFELFSFSFLVGGKIEKIKVLRGEALFSAGDYVKAGDVIVRGDITVNNVPVKVNVIAEATIIYKTTYTYLSENDGEEDIAELLSRGFFGDREPCDISITRKLQGQTYIYTAELSFIKKMRHWSRHVL